MNGSDVAPELGEPRVPRLVLWAIYVIVLAVAVMVAMAAVVFLLNPPPS
jgi:hypothetical protein